MAHDLGGVAGVMQRCGPGLVAAALALSACASGPATRGNDAPPAAKASPSSQPALDGGLDRAPRALADAGPDAASDATSPQLSAAAVAEIDAVVQGATARGEIPGAVVLVVHRDRVVLRKAYGQRRLKPDRAPMTEDTVFDLASLTKPVVTATAIALLVERGALAWSDPVGRHLPAFAKGDQRSVTVEQLLRHTSGLPPGARPSAYARGLGPALEHISRLPLRHRPGSKRLYSDLGYVVLGALVEQIAQQPLDRFAQGHIFGPLKMDSTAFRPGPPLVRRVAPTEQRDGRWLAGAVHDPAAAALGGVAGHAGLFSTADDLGRFARMLLAGGALEGERLLSAATVARLVSPSGSGGADHSLAFTARAGGVAHSGFTGTYLWLDPERDVALVALASRLHPAGKGDASRLRRELVAAVRAATRRPTAEAGAPGAQAVRLGVDELLESGLAALHGRRVGLVTNHTGLTSAGLRTIDALAADGRVELVTIFSPEHGLAGTAEGKVASGRDGKTGVRVVSLYGSRKRPQAADLSGLDALVFDIQDIGARFYTYISTLGYLLEAAAQHNLPVIVLDRPNPIDGVTVEGPLLDAGRESFIGYHRIPVRHGMTVGELARLFNAERRIGAKLTVVPMKGWRREQRFDQTGLRWIATSPNIRRLDAALLYPGIGLLEATNLSVGRGTERPFEQIGAPWLDGKALAHELSAAGLPGIRVAPVVFTPTSSTYAKERCEGVAFELTDPAAFRAVRTGIEIAYRLRQGYPAKWRAQRVGLLLGNATALRALLAGEPPAAIVASWQADLAAFRQRRQPFLLYGAAQ